MNIQKMMQQAQQMQERLQKQMGEMTVEASSGGGMVTATITGHKNLVGLKIDPEVVSKEDVEMLQDLIVAAINDAHRKVDEARAYPEEFVQALTQSGWMAALIPEEYGGSGLGLAEASVIMEEINRSGGNSGACHGQMYNMNTLVRHGSEAQRQKYLPRIASGELRLQSMGVTEPTTGTDTTQLKTTAVKKVDRLSLIHI